MTSNNSQPKSSQSASLKSEAAHRLTEQIIREFGDADFSANVILDSHPELRDHSSCVVDLAYEEFCRGREKGHSVAASKFVEAFSTVQQSLYRVIEFDQILRDHPSLVQEIPEERWPKADEDFLDFELTEQIGRGALSRVFLARHNSLGGKPVVVKVCVKGEREADLLGKLEHPCIGEVHSITIEEATGLAAICMPFQTRFTMHHVAEWMTGLPTGKTSSRFKAGQVAAHIREFSFLGEESESAVPSLAHPFHADDSLEQVILKWGVQLGEALGHAHKNGVLHCDVKPGNVLVLPDLSSRLLDFNLATSGVDESRLVGGTLPYMAPEQLNFIQATDADLSEKQAFDSTDQVIDERTDVFGLCATIWHMATGCPPFGTAADNLTRRESVEIMLIGVQAGVQLPAMAEAEKTLSPATIQLLLKGMSVRREDRQSSMEQLTGELLARVSRRSTPRKVLPILAVAGLCLAAAAYSFTFPALSPTVAPEPIPDPVPIAIAQARQFLDAGNHQAAEEALAPFRFANDTCRIIELVARTSQLQSLDFSSMMAQENDSELFEEWNKVLGEWIHLAEHSGHRELCLLNAYLVKLETLASREGAFDLFDQLESSSLESVAGQRRVLLRQTAAFHDAKSYNNTAAISQLVDSMLEGSRGEFIALFRMAATEWRNNPSREMRANLERMMLSLDSELALAEPCVVRFYRSAKLDNDDENFAISRRIYGVKNSGEFNNLGQHLRIPAE